MRIHCHRAAYVSGSSYFDLQVCEFNPEKVGDHADRRVLACSQSGAEHVSRSRGIVWTSDRSMGADRNNHAAPVHWFDL